SSNMAFVATIRLDGTSTVPQPMAAGSLATADPFVVVDHGGTARVIGPLFLSDAPYFGAERLVIQTIGSTEAPAPPSLEIRTTGSGALLAWNQVPAAVGYRIEYRNSRHDWQE